MKILNITLYHLTHYKWRHFENAGHLGMINVPGHFVIEFQDSITDLTLTMRPQPQLCDLSLRRKHSVEK